MPCTRQKGSAEAMIKWFLNGLALKSSYVRQHIGVLRDRLFSLPKKYKNYSRKSKL
jgi:hypothetical protein